MKLINPLSVSVTSIIDSLYKLLTLSRAFFVKSVHLPDVLKSVMFNWSTTLFRNFRNLIETGFKSLYFKTAV